MNLRNLPKLMAAAVALTCATACVTEKDITAAPLSRYVKDGVYRNTLKGYQFKWPEGSAWRFSNLPEFDVSFNHVEGYAQLLFLGSGPLVRREFPDGFVEWLMDRLQVQSMKILSREQITTEPLEEFRISLDCTFLVLPNEKFGVNRKVMIFAYRKAKTWLACIYLAPENSYDKYFPEVEAVAKDIALIKE